MIVEFNDNAFGGSAFYGVFVARDKTALMVDIDIKPLASANGIDLMKWKNVRVAVQGSGEFDALSADPATAQLGPLGAMPRRHEAKDYDRDGYLERIVLSNAPDCRCGLLPGGRKPVERMRCAGSYGAPISPSALPTALGRLMNPPSHRRSRRLATTRPTPLP